MKLRHCPTNVYCALVSVLQMARFKQYRSIADTFVQWIVLRRQTSSEERSCPQDDDDQIVTDEDASRLRAKLLKNSPLKIYPGLSARHVHGESGPDGPGAPTGRLARHISIRHEDSKQMTRDPKSLPIIAGLLAFTCLLTSAGTGEADSQSAATVVASQIRSQGFPCEGPTSVERVRADSAPNRTVYILSCRGLAYRVVLIPDQAALVSQVE